MYSDGTFLNSCKKCPPGQAAIPGFYLNTFDDKVIHPLLKQRCLGDSCGNVSIVIPSKEIIKMFGKPSTQVPRNFAKFIGKHLYQTDTDVFL